MDRGPEGAEAVLLCPGTKGEVVPDLCSKKATFSPTRGPGGGRGPGV